MIVTFPPNLRHEIEEISPSYYEDHLLERVSLLEFRLKQLSEQLAMAYEFISRQSEFFEKDHLSIAAFTEAVLNVEPNLSEKLAAEFALTYNQKTNEIKIETKQQKILQEILLNHENPNAELFTHLVKEGIKLLEQNEEKQAFRTLERASLLSTENIALQLFIAEKLFRLDKFDAAKVYLEKIYDISPQNLTALLLLGAVYANDFEAEKARKMLSVLAGLPKSRVCANYIWGMLSAFEENWNEAIAAFRECLELSESPEINYLIGAAYFENQNFPQALELLELAVLEDAKFADAWFLIYVIYENLDKPTKAENAHQMAFMSKEAGAMSLKFMRKNDSAKIDVAIPFLHLKSPEKRLLTNGSLRMTKFFKQLVFDSID